MLHDKKFINLERDLFKNIEQLDNSLFAESVWAYANNHKQEQGLLKPALSNKIQQVIIEELVEHRVNSLDDEDLGLIAQSLTKLPMINDKSINW